MIIAHNGLICVNQEARIDLDGDNGGASDAVFTHLTLKSNLTIGSKDPEEDNMLYGELTDFNVWTKPLDHDEARLFTQNCTHEIVQTGLLIQWKSDRMIERYV